MALGLGLAACQKGMSVGFTTAAALVHELMEARDDRRLLNLQRQLARLRLLIIDELGFVPLSTTGAELLFEVFSQRSPCEFDRDLACLANPENRCLFDRHLSNRNGYIWKGQGCKAR